MKDLLKKKLLIKLLEDYNKDDFDADYRLYMSATVICEKLKKASEKQLVEWGVSRLEFEKVIDTVKAEVLDEFFESKGGSDNTMDTILADDMLKIIIKALKSEVNRKIQEYSLSDSEVCSKLEHQLMMLELHVMCDDKDEIYDRILYMLQKFDCLKYALPVEFKEYIEVVARNE